MSDAPFATSIELTTPLTSVRAIPRFVTDALATLEITNVGRLIAHLPMRHERHEAETNTTELDVGAIVSVRGEVTSTKISNYRKKPRIEAVISDGHGTVDAVWFNATYLYDKLKPGVRVLLQGKSKDSTGGIQLTQPKITFLRDGAEPPARESRLKPIYSAGAGVNTNAIERSILTVLDAALPLIEEHYTDDYRTARDFPLLADAYRMMHAPADEKEVARAQRRLAYDELFLLQLGVAMKRAHLRRAMRSPSLAWNSTIDERIRSRLPFTLTPGQDSAIAALVKDLTTTVPTNRLIQGDVGSGKTVVALYAMLMAVASGHQAALMAPTEILAEQHFASITKLLSGSRVRMSMLTGATPDPERVQILGGLVDGSIDMVIGTHALLTDTVKFRSLALAVIDEQHRFGVHQRATLRGKGTNDDGANVTPHIVVMTATPIPRTLAITLFGDLDITSIAGLPPGRKAVRTRVAPLAQRSLVYDFVRQRIEAGEQAFVVTPTIDAAEITSENDDEIASVEATLRDLEQGPLAGKRLAAMHGRMKRSARDIVMERFRMGTIDALVATTVIEVGVDVPNATTMVVEQADRFGLAQLHQLRGRVGRGDKPSHCLLIADPTTPSGVERLRTLSRVSDGFALAEKDFEIRGPGELFGTRQSGLPPFVVADLMRDRELLALARSDAAKWVDRSPTLARAEEAVLKRRLMKMYGASLGLGDVG